jgi:metal-responsive CopG/Arc/MetJ family transcriptional regulator
MLRQRGYRQVSLPIALVERIDDYVKTNPQEGFTSVPEFIRQAIREKLIRVEDGKKDSEQKSS